MGGVREAAAIIGGHPKRKKNPGAKAGVGDHGDPAQAMGLNW
jgi:hypothetical protein